MKVIKQVLRRKLLVLLMTLLALGSETTSAQSAIVDQFLAMPAAERERLMREVGISPDEILGAIRQGGGRGLGGGPPNAGGNSAGSSPAAGASGLLGFGAMAPGRGAGPSVPSLDTVFVPQQPLEDDPRLEGTVDYGRRVGLDTFRRQTVPIQELYSIPVPDDYVVGPGDAFLVSLFGNESAQFYLPVSRDGRIDLPELGPLRVSGIALEEARRLIKDRVGAGKIGVEATVGLEQLKAVQVTVTGEVERPGVYIVPALASMSQLLTLAGGPTANGSLRDVRLIGSTTTEVLDLYDLAVRGERVQVRGLQSGDSLHVPLVQSAAQVTGAIRRPGVYETVAGETVVDLLELAGGLAPHSNSRSVVARRFGSDGTPEVFEIDLQLDSHGAIAAEDGMVLWIPSASDVKRDVIELVGEFTAPGVRAWRPGMTLGDVLGAPDRDILLDRVDQDLAYVARTDPQTRALTFLTFSVREVLDSGADAALSVQPLDALMLFPLAEIAEADKVDYETRQSELEAMLSPPNPFAMGAATSDPGSLDGAEASGGASPGMAGQAAGAAAIGLPYPAGLLGYGIGSPLTPTLTENQERSAREALEEPEPQDRHDLLSSYMTRLIAQAQDGQRVPVFTVLGEVHSPGMFPIAQGMSLQQAISASGGLLETADTGSAVILRKPSASGSLRVFTAGLDAGSFNVEIVPGDVVTVRSDLALAQELEVEISGEVGSPGLYRLPVGSRLSDLLDLAGGVTSAADLRSAIFSRARLRAMEEEVRERYLTEIRQSLIAGEVAGDSRSADPAVLQLMNEFQSALDDQSNGRLQIDLPRLAAGDDGANLELIDGDRLTIPARTRAVSVAGQVRYPGSFAHVPGMSVHAYLEMAGGYSTYADDRAVFVVRGSGAVELVAPRRRFQISRSSPELLPGDRIVVPINYDYVNGFDLAKEIVQFVYQAGIGLAAVVAALD